MTEYSYDGQDRVITKKISHRRDSMEIEVFDEITYDYVAALGITLISKVSNKYVVQSFKYQSQPPYDLLAFSQKPTALGESLGVKEKNHKIRPAITGPLGQVELSGEILLKNQYDEAGRRLTTVGRYAGLSQTVTMEYDFFGRRIKEQHSGGLVGTFTYDNMDRFNSLNWSGGGISMSEVISSRSPSGLISKIDREFGTFNMSYNQKNELSRMSYAGSVPLDVQFNTDFNYDSSGNYLGRTNLTFNNINNFLVNTSSAKEYFPDAHGLGYRHSKYDYSFNLKQSYKYYPWGQLREMKEYVGSSERAKINYYYDGFGRRILKIKKLIGESVSTTEFSHLGLEDKVLLASVTKDSVPAKSLYVDGVGIDDHQFEISNVTGVTSYARNHLGSVISGSATGGKGVFGPFGENVGLLVQKNSPSIPIVYGFTGREFDPESGFYYYRARYYDPETGRFLTKDPIGLAGGDTNLYRYVGNNPVNYTDPYGLSMEDSLRSLDEFWVRQGQRKDSLENSTSGTAGEQIEAIWDFLRGTARDAKDTFKEATSNLITSANVPSSEPVRSPASMPGPKTNNTPDYSVPTNNMCPR